MRPSEPAMSSEYARTSPAVLVTAAVPSRE